MQRQSPLVPGALRGVRQGAVRQIAARQVHTLRHARKRGLGQERMMILPGVR